MSSLEKENDITLLLDSNLLIYAFINVKSIFEKNKIDRREYIYSKIAEYFFYNSPWKILVPRIIIDIELPRIITRMIIQRNITDETKIKILLNTIKSIDRILHEFEKIDKCSKIDTWKVKYLKKAAGLYKQLRLRLERERIRGKHQDLILMSTAIIENSVFLTGDRDIYLLSKGANIKNRRSIYISLW